MPLTFPWLGSATAPSSGCVKFLENLPGGRAGEANRSDPQSGVSRLIPVNVSAPVPTPAKALRVLGLGRPGLRGQLPAARASIARARNTGLPPDTAIEFQTRDETMRERRARHVYEWRYVTP